MTIRIYVSVIIFIKLSQGCREYFSRFINLLDLFLLMLNLFTIFMYMKFHNTAQELEDISFALLIFVRNSSQFLRLIVLIKNQQAVSVYIIYIQKNVEEIINFNTLFEEKKFEILSNKKNENEAILFVEDENKKKDEIKFTNYNYDHHDFKI